MDQWLFLGLAISVLDVCDSDCVWNINKDISLKDPVFFRSVNTRTQLLVPTNADGLHLKANERIRVMCPGAKNYINNTGQNELNVTCINGLELWNGERRLSIRELECSTLVSGELRRSNKTCDNTKGTVLSIGYQSEQGWMQLIEVCYNLDMNIALYAQHVIYGSAIGGAFIGNDRPSFKMDGLQKNLQLNKAYRKTEQSGQFVKLLGKNQADKYIQNKSFLSKGHLAPDADFIFHSGQRTTYFYANVVPQWQAINGGNWKRLEGIIRNAAKEKREDFKIWTGTHDILELKDDGNEMTRIFLLDNDNLPVPKMIWKVVCNIRKQCIGFIVLNNPFAESNEYVCNDVCKESNWFQTGFDNNGKGLVSCCELKEIQNRIPSIPKINSKALLRNI